MAFAGGCSRVVVVGEDSSDAATDEAVEKYADVGVTIAGVGAETLTLLPPDAWVTVVLVWRDGRMAEPEGGEEETGITGEVMF